MKLDRNITNPRRGKYALIKLREAGVFIESDYPRNLKIPAAIIDFGDTEDSDFFVIRLKDKYAGPALQAYAEAAHLDDPEYALEIYELALKARNHPNKHIPD